MYNRVSISAEVNVDIIKKGNFYIFVNCKSKNLIPVILAGLVFLTL